MVPSSCHPGMCRSSTGTEHNEHRDPDQEDDTTSQHARKRGPERQEALDARHAPCLSVLTASPLCQLLLAVRPEIIGKIMLLACRSNAFADPRPSSLPARPRATPWPKDRAWGPGPEQVLPRLHRCPRTFPNPGPHCYWRSDCRALRPPSAGVELIEQVMLWPTSTATPPPTSLRPRSLGQSPGSHDNERLTCR